MGQHALGFFNGDRVSRESFGDLMIDLRSAKLALGPLCPHDITSEYINTLNDKEYMRFSRNSKYTHTFATQISYIRKFEKTSNLLLAIKETGTNALVGSLTCYVNFNTLTVEIGILIFKSFSGRDYSTEALRILLPYLESSYPGMTAVIGTDRQNFAMQKVARKLAFESPSSEFEFANSTIQFIKNFPRLTSNSTASVPDLIKNARTIGVVANDAGGAEQIAWMLKQLPQKSLALLGGPAKRIFEFSNVSFEEVGVLSELMACDLLITGSGWMSDLEMTAISEAKSRGVNCITILDHWVNYLSRFGDDKHSYPQIIAVTNTLALQIAQEVFPNSVVYLLPDFQLIFYQGVIQSRVSQPDSVLLVSEPLLKLSSKFEVNESEIVELIHLGESLREVKRLEKVIIRLHPSQIHDQKILNLLQDYGEVVDVSTEPWLIDDLLQARVVLGLNSYALYISSMCGIQTYSYFADEENHWTRHYPCIKSVSSLP